MELLLIRHAEPVRIVGAEGPADPPLRDRGRQQAERLAAWLAEEDLDALWSSPMRRALETAAPVAARHALDVVVDDDLAEFDREATSYIPIEEIRGTDHPEWLAMVEGRIEPNSAGVTAEQFQAGVVAAMERVIASNPSRKVAVVCHGGV